MAMWEGIKKSEVDAMIRHQAMATPKLERFPMGKYGPKVNPTGEYVRFDYAGRIYLGEVVGAYYDDVTGCVRCEVKHFNGEPWGLNPPLSSLGWIKQD